MNYEKDRFDDVPADLKRRGAHRSPRTRLSKLSSWLVAIAAVIVLVGVGVGVMWFIDGQVRFSAGGQDSPAATTTEAAPSDETTPTPEGPVATKDTSIPVQVLNGAGQGGLATAGSKELDASGWNVTTVDDADASDYATTLVVVTDESELGAAMGVVQDLGFGTAAVNPAKATSGEITVILGKDSVNRLL